MLEIFGRGYVIDNCIAFLQKKKKHNDIVYYITDSLMYISQNIANRYGGKTISKRYYEIENPKPEEHRTASEIISNIKKKLENHNGPT